MEATGMTASLVFLIRDPRSPAPVITPSLEGKGKGHKLVLTASSEVKILWLERKRQVAA